MHATANPTSTATLPGHRPSRRTWLLMGLAGLSLAACSGPSLALGQLVSLDVVDRDSGQVLEIYHHRGRAYIAGRPGARYALRISNRSPGRVLVVAAVDGVNIVSGQTAAWGQGGYVLAPWQTYDLTGWRKSDRQVAAFEFTSLPDSYAARTGRPLDVGVIGVAVFRERPRPVVLAPPPVLQERRAHTAEGSAVGGADSGAAGPATPAPAARAQAQAPGGTGPAAAAESRDEARSRLGTGHGEREYSQVSRTEFERASTTPAEIVSLQYDRYDNLVAAGVIPGERYGRPRPFPGLRENAGYVPDPPRW